MRRVAQLARIQITDDEAALYRTQLAAVLDHATMLSQLDLTGVTPMSHPMDAECRLDEDAPGPTLPIEALLEMAPETVGRFLKVPRVMGDSAGA